MSNNRGGKKQEKQYEELLLEVRRVTRVATGGRRLSFRAVVVIGDRKGKIGLGISKAQDVTGALKKAVHDAYKNIVTVPLVGAKTVPYPISYKYKSAVIKLLPAAGGTGLKAGSSVRSVLDLAGYNNILSKIVGTNNKLNNAIATIQALSQYKDFSYEIDQEKSQEKSEDKSEEKSQDKPQKEEKQVDTKVEKVESETQNVVSKKTTKKTTKKTAKKTTKKSTKQSTPQKKTTKKATNKSTKKTTKKTTKKSTK